jgi:hypothetical protein
VRSVVHALIAVHGESVRLRRALLEAYLAHGFRDEDALLTSDVIEWIRTSEAAASLVGHLSPARWFVLSRGVLGAVRSAFWERPAILSDPRFEDELVSLALACLEGTTRGG